MSAEEDAKDEGQAALAALGRALAKQPERDGEAFSETTERLCQMRDRLIALRRSGQGSEERLGRLNAVISTTLAGHFPLGRAPWPEIELARGMLQELVAEL